MDIQIDGKTLNIPNGTMALFVDPSGSILWVGKVDGEVFQDLMKQPLGSFDPLKDAHTEVEVEVTSVPPSSDRLMVQGIDAVRICRNQFGNIVKCPPR